MTEVRPVEIRTSWSRVGQVVAAAFSSAYPVIGGMRSDDVIKRAVAWLVFGTAVVALSAVLRMRAMGCLMRLDADGVTVRGRRTVAWSEVCAVRWVKPGRKRVEAVVFLPQPGAVLPEFPRGIRLSHPRRSSAALTKRFGSPLVVLPGNVDAQVSGIRAAVEAFGDVPFVVVEPGSPADDEPGSPADSGTSDGTSPA
jgi:hypothetical protein